VSASAANASSPLFRVLVKAGYVAAPDVSPRRAAQTSGITPTARAWVDHLANAATATGTKSVPKGLAMPDLVKKAQVCAAPLKEAAAPTCKACGGPVTHHANGWLYGHFCSAECRRQYYPPADKNDQIRERFAARLQPRLILGKSRPAR
jgi:hypothetical protein